MKAFSQASKKEGAKKNTKRMDLFVVRLVIIDFFDLNKCDPIVIFVRIILNGEKIQDHSYLFWLTCWEVARDIDGGQILNTDVQRRKLIDTIFSKSYDCIQHALVLFL
jgi:hypothetical protein